MPSAHTTAVKKKKNYLNCCLVDFQLNYVITFTATAEDDLYVKLGVKLTVVYLFRRVQKHGVKAIKTWELCKP